jgi:Bacterial SH3 domain/Replication-relaxation
VQRHTFRHYNALGEVAKGSQLFMPSAPTFDLLNLLLGLAWLGELDREQIARLWFHVRSVSTVEKTLAELCKQGLIQKRSWSKRDAERNVTVPQLARWSLTPTGHAQVKQRDQYPIKAAQPRQKRLIEHDARTTGIIVRLIELARSRDLSGVAVIHELRLHPERSRPILDALVIFQLHGGFNHTHLVPWSRDLPTEDERLFRFAIEADNDTEPPEVLRGKARAYRGVNSDTNWQRWWRQHYGPPPLPLWVAPDAARVQAIHTHWTKVWPEGMWYITDDAGLMRNRWLKYYGGQETRIEVAFPAPPPALPPPPPPSTTPLVPPPPPAPEAPPPPAEAAPPATSAGAGQIVLARATHAPRPLEEAPTAADYAMITARYGEQTLQEQLSEVWSALPRRALARLICASVALMLLVGVLSVGARLTNVASSRWQAFMAVRAAPSATPVATIIPSAPSAGTDQEPNVCGEARISARRVNLRAAPTRRSDVLRQLPQGAVVDLLCDAPQVADGYTWRHVQRQGDEQTGWIATAYLVLLQ